MSESKEENLSSDENKMEIEEETKSNYVAKEDVLPSKDKQKDEIEQDTNEKDKSDSKTPVKEKSNKDKDKKDESDKEESEHDESEDDEAEVGLFDRPIEMTGIRARKKVERFSPAVTVSPKEKFEIPAGKGVKLGDCPRIELQLQKKNKNDLKPLSKILFNRVLPVFEIKKSIRKFCGFAFSEESEEFDRRKASIEKLTIPVLKKISEILDIERSGTKEDMVKRIMLFLSMPKDSGKALPKKNKRKSDDKKSRNGKKATKSKADKDVSSEASDSGQSSSDDVESDTEEKEKLSTPKKPKVSPKKSVEKVKAEKKNVSAKGSKRKSGSKDDSESSDDEPSAKKAKMPSDEEIKKLIKSILDDADLQEITMKNVIKQVSDAYPGCDLGHKKGFIKTFIKSVIS